MSDPLQALRARFVARCATDLQRLRTLSNGSLEAEELRALAHSLAGAAGTFGFPDISEAAGRLDDCYALGEPPRPEMVAALTARLQRLVDGAG